MQIGAFAKEAGISPDTVRFYVRKGLLTPETGRKGGRNPYQIFTDEHVRIAMMIRMAKSLGVTLQEFAALNEQFRAGGGTRECALEIISGQLARLDAKAAELDRLRSYLQAKMAWMKGGEIGPAPTLGAQACGSA